MVLTSLKQNINQNLKSQKTPHAVLWIRGHSRNFESRDLDNCCWYFVTKVMLQWVISANQNQSPTHILIVPNVMEMSFISISGSNYFTSLHLSHCISNADIGKSTGPRSSTGENSGGPMKTLSVPVLLSGKKSCCKESLYGDSNVKKKIGPIKSFGGPVKLGFSMWLLVLRSGKGPKVFPMSAM